MTSFDMPHLCAFRLNHSIIDRPSRYRSRNTYQRPRIGVIRLVDVVRCQLCFDRRVRAGTLQIGVGRRIIHQDEDRSIAMAETTLVGNGRLFHGPRR